MFVLHLHNNFVNFLFFNEFIHFFYVNFIFRNYSSSSELSSYLRNGNGWILPKRSGIINMLLCWWCRALIASL